MSIVPFNEGRGRVSNPSSSSSSFDSPLDLWDRFATDLWEPFSDFPFPMPMFTREMVSDFGFGSAVNTRLDWKETPRVHVWKVVLPGFTDEDVLVELQDDRMLQISVESGRFMTKFKVPDDGLLDQLKATMNHGVLTVTVPKQEVSTRRPNVRAIEISGE